MRFLANLLIGLGLGYLIWVFAPIAKAEMAYWWMLHRGQVVSTQQTFGEVLGLYQKSSFGELLNFPPPLTVAPTDLNGSIVIEKISVNAPVIWDVSITDKKEYLTALKKGIAHASQTPKPSEENQNTYLFAHSTLNPLEIKKYSAAFTLLSKLEKDDLVAIFYQGQRFDYRVKNKELVEGFNLIPLTRTVQKPTLTLQTCDPPGIPRRRLIVTAELEKVY